MTDVAEVAKELPLRYQEEPFVAYKTVKVALSDGLLKLSGSWETITIDDTARCKKYPRPVPEHDAPYVGCDCGFWALKKKPGEPNYSGNVVATVEMFGTVIHGKDGYRASRQRVLRIELPRACECCALMEDRRRMTNGMYFAINGSGHPLCVDHGETALSINAAIRMTPAEIAAQIGTEVGWLD